MNFDLYVFTTQTSDHAFDCCFALQMQTFDHAADLILHISISRMLKLKSSSTDASSIAFSTWFLCSSSSGPASTWPGSCLSVCVSLRAWELTQ